MIAPHADGDTVAWSERLTPRSIPFPEALASNLIVDVRVAVQAGRSQRIGRCIRNSHRLKILRDVREHPVDRAVDAVCGHRGRARPDGARGGSSTAHSFRGQSLIHSSNVARPPRRFRRQASRRV
jgi:hypothetical protein